MEKEVGQFSWQAACGTVPRKEAGSDRKEGEECQDRMKGQMEHLDIGEADMEIVGEPRVELGFG